MVEFDEAEIKQEMKKIVVSSLDLEDEAWNKIVACTTYEEMLQFVADDKGMNSTTDLQMIERELVRIVQQQHFSGPDDDRFKKLPVFKDTAGLLRVKTRLSSGDFTEDFTFPLVLPSRCEVVEALVLHEHRKECHAEDKHEGDKVGETLRKDPEAGTRTRFGREVKAPERFPHSSDK
ncbi:unnamed protein product [Orchesella dallaii]|uniref:Uncharacterized protein n=1 Tax=Orchesella dallaii TaxID=48710 RepID=A0ABP1QR42_9HEXA